MESLSWGLIGTVVGTVVGAIASIATTVLINNNSRRLQNEAVLSAARERSREFQRNNLIELQEAFFLGMRLVAQAHLEDIKSFRQGMRDKPVPMLSEQLNQDLMVSNRKLSILAERVIEDELRRNIKETRNRMTKVTFSQSEEESKLAIQKAAAAFDRLMENLGATLREKF